MVRPVLAGASRLLRVNGDSPRDDRNIPFTLVRALYFAEKTSLNLFKHVAHGPVQRVGRTWDGSHGTGSPGRPGVEETDRHVYDQGEWVLKKVH